MKWDYYKVARGTNLTRSRESKEGFRGMVHGRRGIARQAEFFKIDRQRSFLGTVLALAAKSSAALVLGGGAILLSALLLSAFASGVKDGIAKVAGVVSSASSYLTLGMAAACAFTILMVARKFTWARRRPGSRRRGRGTGRHDGSARSGMTALHPRLQAWTPIGPVPQARGVHPFQAGWYADPWNAYRLRYWDGRAWTPQTMASRVQPFTSAPTHPVQRHVPSNYAPQRIHQTQDSTAPRAMPAQLHPSEEHRVAMTREQWERMVRAWMAADSVEQELWHRISHAHISNADAATLDAQRRLEQMSHEQVSEERRLLLEMSPRLRDELEVPELLAFLLVGSSPSASARARLTPHEEPRYPQLSRRPID